MSEAIGVVGLDGKTPLYQPNNSWKIYSIDEIYLGKNGYNKFIPNVNDWVVEPKTGSIYVVVSLDNVT